MQDNAENNPTIKDAVLAHLEGLHQKRVRSTQATSEGVTHAESRAENDKDTRAIEASYLARGQAARVEALADGIHRIKLLSAPSQNERVGLGHVVTLEDVEGSFEKVFLLLPVAGGERVLTFEGEVMLVTPRAPLGQQLMNSEVGDSVRQGTVELEVVRIRSFT